jgi:hypothetical protein
MKECGRGPLAGRVLDSRAFCGAAFQPRRCRPEFSPEGAELNFPRKRSSLVFFVVWMLIFAPDAFAYLDPGTGSLIVQSVVAALAAVGFGTRMYWRRIRQWFRRSGSPADPPPDRRPTGPA